MTLWIAVLAACAAAYLLKLAGYLVPAQILQTPWDHRITTLLPVALLTSLVVSQAFLSSGGTPTLDARAAGVGAAVLLLILRAPFIVVVVAAAAVAALVRMWVG